MVMVPVMAGMERKVVHRGADDDREDSDDGDDRGSGMMADINSGI